jgi:hypothetical protein
MSDAPPSLIEQLRGLADLPSHYYEFPILVGSTSIDVRYGRGSDPCLSLGTKVPHVWGGLGAGDYRHAAPLCAGIVASFFCAFVIRGRSNSSTVLALVSASAVAIGMEIGAVVARLLWH